MTMNSGITADYRDAVWGAVYGGRTQPWACTLVPPGNYDYRTMQWLSMDLSSGIATRPAPNLLWAVLFNVITRGRVCV